MAVNLSPLAGAGWQFFDDNGVPLAGGLLYTYAAGTTTPATTYTDSTGLTAHANPIILDSAGRVTSEIWLTSTAAYKFNLRLPTDVSIWVKDNISGVATQNEIDALATALAAPSGSSLVGFIQSATGAVARTAQAKLRDITDAKDFGAAGDGVADDKAAIALADAAGPVLLTAGTYKIASNLTLTHDVTFAPGAKLTVPTGVTVTFSGAVIAPVNQIFDCAGTGEIVLNWRFTNEAYPEWWGAISDGATDCLTAIHACLKAAQTTKLHPGDYFVSGTVKIIYDNRWLIGSGSQYNGVNDKVTRLLVTDGSSYALQVGPDAYPGSINAFQKQNIVRDLYVGRTVVPVISSNCAGVNCQYTLYAEIHNIKSAEHIIGFRFYGTVYTKCYDCSSVRATAGTGAGTDSWYGYYYDGNASITAAGGNASVYTNYCSAGCDIAALQTGVSYGFYANAAHTDLFFESVETVSCNIGMYVEGNAPSGTAPSNTDLQIKNPIHDAFYGVGTYFKNINKYGSATLLQGYHGANAAAAHCILVENCDGSVAIMGGQLPMYGATTTTAIGVISSKGVVIDRVQILEATAYGVVLSSAENCDIRPIVKNFLNVLAQAAVTSIGSSRNTVSPIVYGTASYVTYGINAQSTANTYNEFNCTGINSTTVGASANKLLINGIQVIATGLSGNNLVSGVMA